MKAVGESVEKPIEYYVNNVQGTISLLEAMKATNVKTLVFSSSATVYGDPQYLPIDEDHPTSAINAYGRSKLHIEEMLKDITNSDDQWKIISLRYFNPVGAHESGLIGEDPNGLPNNLMPYLAQVASGKLPHLKVFGDDYPTSDGTGVRDYIHVMDLAEAHMAGLAYLHSKSRYSVMNLGTGLGVSVMQMISAYKKACGRDVSFEIIGRRNGDIGESYAMVKKAEKQLQWKSSRSLDKCCEDSWRYIALKNYQD